MLKVYTLLVAAFLSACSSAPKEPPLPPPVINSLTIIAPARPSNYVLDQSSVGTFVLGAVVPLLGFAHRAQLESQKESFREAMTARDVSIDKEFTAAIQSELQKLGFKVTLMEPIQRSPRWPDWFEYEKLQFNTDALLHLSFYEIGLATSGKAAPIYVPKLNSRGSVIVKGRNKSYADEYVYFGLDAPTDDRELSLVRDPQKSFSSLSDAMANLSKLEDTYRAAIPAIAKRMAEQLHDRLK
jgi:hypothetical protein